MTQQEEDYIIVSKRAIQKRIEELIFQREREPDNYTQSYLDGKIKQLRELLSKSVPLLPEIEKAFLSGREIGEQYHDTEYTYTESVQQYLKQLKLSVSNREI